jgi:RNA-directed DNA polymerase
MVRYADDFVILCRTAEQAARALEIVQQWTTDNGLTLHPTKTRIVDSRSVSFAFLGYEVHGQKHWLRDQSLKKLREAVRTKTRRTNENLLKCSVSELNQTLRGWFGYFQHSSYRTVFRELDAWLRMRFRSILRKRRCGTIRGQGLDQIRWPNDYFQRQRLFSLVTAHAVACQSSRR